MAILAIYAHGKILRVAVKSEACIKTASFPHSESGHEIRAKQILPWLGEHKGIDAELKLIVTNEPSPVARSLGDYFNLLVHVASPATPNECPPQALVTGTPLLKRRCRIDAFTLRFLARQEAEARSLDPASARFIVAHLDEENQLAALVGTEVIDGLTSFDEGPFGLRQSGGLPFDGVIDLCVASGNREQTLGVLHSEGGLEGYLGVQGLEELWSKQGERADLIREALIYQISKEIGALVTVLKGRVDALILGGDLVDAKPFGQAIKRRIEFLGPIVMYPGNQVLPALLAAGERVQV